MLWKGQRDNCMESRMIKWLCEVDAAVHVLTEAVPTIS
jgi:hypothetical protein